MEHIISIMERGISARSKLEDMLYSDTKHSNQLRRLIENLDMYEEVNDQTRDWWIAYNEEREAVVGLIAVRYRDQESVLEAAWTNTVSSHELEYTITALIDTWEASARDSKYLVINLEENSQIVAEFDDLGFYFDKPLVLKYEAPTRIYIFDEDTEFILRKPRLDELETLYDELISVDLDKDSLIYVSKKDFLNFKNQFPMLQKNSLVVVSERDELLGFGASFLDPTGERPTLFGPHAKSLKVEDVIISEFLTFWRLQGKDNLTILRTKYLPDTTRNKYAMEMSKSESIVRYVKSVD